MRVAILVFPGVEELDFVGFLEVLAVANRVKKEPYFRTELVGVRSRNVTCSGGLRIVADRPFSETMEYDLLFVPGGGASSGTGVDLLLKDDMVLGVLKRAIADGKRVWSVCTGGLVLGKAGLLRRKQATTHHAYLDRIELAGAVVVHERVVTDGSVTTGGGISSSVDVGLALVEMELGEKVKKETQVRMEYPPPG